MAPTLINRRERLYYSTTDGREVVSNSPSKGAALLKPGSRGHHDASRIYSRLRTANNISKGKAWMSPAKAYSEAFGCKMPSICFNIR